MHTNHARGTWADHRNWVPSPLVGEGQGEGSGAGRRHESVDGDSAPHLAHLPQRTERGRFALPRESPHPIPLPQGERGLCIATSRQIGARDGVALGGWSKHEIRNSTLLEFAYGRWVGVERSRPSVAAFRRIGKRRFRRRIHDVKYRPLEPTIDQTEEMYQNNVRTFLRNFNSCTDAVRPSRRALRALLRMRYTFDGTKEIPHPEEAAKRPSRRTRDADPASFRISSQPLSRE